GCLVDRVDRRDLERRRRGGQLGRQPPGELAVALARRSLAGGEPRDAEPRVIGKQRHEMLPDDARGAEYADVDFLHQTAAGTAAFSARASSIAARPSRRSATRSRWCSQPVDRRISVSERPSFARSSAGIDACVMRAGWQTSALTPPRLSPSVK